MKIFILKSTMQDASDEEYNITNNHPIMQHISTLFMVEKTTKSHGTDFHNIIKVVSSLEERGQK